MTLTKLLDTQQVADLLGNQKNTLEGHRIKGVGIPYIKVGRLVRYRLADVEAWLDAQTRTSTSEV